MTVEVGTMILTSLILLVALIVMPAWLSTPTLSQPPQQSSMTTREWIELLLAQQQPPPLPPLPSIPGIRERIQKVSAELADTKVCHRDTYIEDAYTNVDTPDTWEEDTIPEIFVPGHTRVGH